MARLLSALITRLSTRKKHNNSCFDDKARQLYKEERTVRHWDWCSSFHDNGMGYMGNEQHRILMINGLDRSAERSYEMGVMDTMYR